MSTPRALILVDVQPTFCEGGELPVEGGNACAARIAEYVTEAAGTYDLLVSTQDWHIDPGAHFSSAPDYLDTWPAHGLAGSANADLHPALQDALTHTGVPVVSIRKGLYAAAYSGFEGTDPAGAPLREVLAEAGIGAVDVVGIAESHCVKATALDALAAGLDTTVLADLTVPVTEELGAAARIEMAAAGIILTTSTLTNERSQA